MSINKEDRLQAEVALLEAMYPEQVTFDSKSCEMMYSKTHISFTLRLPSGYLDDELPEVISASLGRHDGRDELKDKLAACSVGEEILDSLINKFEELVELHQAEGTSNNDDQTQSGSRTDPETKKATVIVWLHHLLNTNKRKQALSPSSSEISGITKPGYPGVLLYTGLATDVYKHVSELRQLNWQAFSVRFESDDEWVFHHGLGVKEFETMKEVVADITEARKEEFMEAMRMK